LHFIIFFCAGNSIVSSGRNVSVQAISGTGALRVGAAYLAKWFPGHKQVKASFGLEKLNGVTAL
jgi:aspartate/tyrosine/aromatic aminotransferase